MDPSTELDILGIRRPVDELKSGPSEEVLAQIRAYTNFTRVNVIGIRILKSTGVLLLALLAVASWEYVSGVSQRFVNDIERANEQADTNLPPIVAAVNSSNIPLVKWLTVARLEKRLAPAQGAQDDIQTRTNIAAALALFGHTERVWPLLGHDADPQLRYSLIRRLVTAGTGHEDEAIVQNLRAACVKKLRDLFPKPPERDKRGAGIRQALILYLGWFDAGKPLREGERFTSTSPPLPTDLKRELIRDLSEAYKTDPDPGVHSAIDWVLQRWGQDVRALDGKLSEERSEAKLAECFARQDCSWQWYVTRNLHTMVVVDPREYDPERLGLSRLRHVFAISTKEVTFRQFDAFAIARDVKGNPTYNKDKPVNPYDKDRPVTIVKLDSVFTYCNRLTEAESKSLRPFFRLAQGDSERQSLRVEDELGYRLPTEAEWAYACRCGAESRYFFGNDLSLLKQFGWFRDNSRANFVGDGSAAGPVGRLMPNQLGLFDIYGNAEEYCIDSPFRADANSVTTRGSNFTRSVSAADVMNSNRRADVTKTNGFRVARTLRKPE
jgi:hypothetical protein